MQENVVYGKERNQTTEIDPLKTRQLRPFEDMPVEIENARAM